MKYVVTAVHPVTVGGRPVAPGKRIDLAGNHPDLDPLVEAGLLTKVESKKRKAETNVSPDKEASK